MNHISTLHEYVPSDESLIAFQTRTAHRADASEQYVE
ncbi:hypothetical protein A2U01_0112782, partial [Trifolium medium]|nr:hypothetical protein [Trifolium medium]